MDAFSLSVIAARSRSKKSSSNSNLHNGFDTGFILHLLAEQLMLMLPTENFINLFFFFIKAAFSRS